MANIRGKYRSDPPEDVIGALQAAARLPWKGTIKIVFQIADNPAHGKAAYL